MKTRACFYKILLITVMGIFLLSGCSSLKEEGIDNSKMPENTAPMQIANPAAVFCEEKGGVIEIVTAEDGSQSGLCRFPDGSKCDEWAFFRGECSPNVDTDAASGNVDNKVVEIARQNLAEILQVDPSTIELRSIEPNTWPDACLGIPSSDEDCPQAETQGFRVIFVVGDQEYVYRTDITGNIIRQEK